MRVVAMVHAYLPHHLAGSEIYLHSLLTALVDAGHECTVVTTQLRRKRSYRVDGVTVIESDRHHRFNTIRTLRPDLVVTHHANTITATKWARRNGARVAHILNDTFPGNFRASSEYSPDLLVFNTQWVREAFYDEHPDDIASVVVHPIADPARHRTDPGEHVTLVNLSAAKGAEVFYVAAERMPDVKFLGIVGAYGQQIVKTGPNIEIRETTSDPRTIWADTRTLLMPSTYESFGLVALEAAHCGIPSIISDLSGPREAMGTAAMFLPVDDVDRWVKAIRSLQSDRKWRAASRAASARASSRSDDRAEFVAAVESMGRRKRVA